ncbi:hypothetical protein [Adlercreutzia mucosicola]
MDADVIWDVVQEDSPKLREGCRASCDHHGLELGVSDT